MQQVPTGADVRQARRAAHWAARQARQVEQRGEKGRAEAWWDRVRALCGTDPELWNDLTRTLENWAARNKGDDNA